MATGNLQMPNLIVSLKEPGVALIELNRPKKRNALSQALLDELTAALCQLQHSPTVRVVVLTSTETAPFCAGADLTELAKITTTEAFRTGWLKDLEDALNGFRKPVIAAVRGFAFGGGFELALMCDMIFASADCQFGFPEIKLATIPGAGGTQRLTKAIGKAKAMEMILTGVPKTAVEMERLGVVTRAISADDNVVEEALAIAKTVAQFSSPAVALAKQAVNAAETTTLGAGLDIERALYYSSFSLKDCREGVAAFLEKRVPIFEHR